METLMSRERIQEISRLVTGTILKVQEKSMFQGEAVEEASKVTATGNQVTGKIKVEDIRVIRTKTTTKLRLTTKEKDSEKIPVLATKAEEILSKENASVVEEVQEEDHTDSNLAEIMQEGLKKMTEMMTKITKSREKEAAEVEAEAASEVAVLEVALTDSTEKIEKRK